MDMKTILIVGGILLVLPIVKQLIGLGLARLLGRAIGQAALNQQPDTIHLSPTGPHAWKNAQKAAGFTSPLSDRGFQDAGSYTIAEMPGAVVRLMAKPEEHFYAAIYAFFVCFAITVGVSLVKRPRPQAELFGLFYSMTPRPS